MIILSSDSQSWGTPPAIFRALHREFDFDTDVCADFLTAKRPDFFPPPWHYPCGPLQREALAQADGLSQSWLGRRNFMNPPYTNRGPNRQEAWLAKAKAEAYRGALVVGLIPARTGTRSWARYVWDGALEIRFVIGRLSFERVPWTGEYLRLRGRAGLHPVPGPAELLSVATFSAAVVVWDGPRDVPPIVSIWDPKEA